MSLSMTSPIKSRKLAKNIILMLSPKKFLLTEKSDPPQPGRNGV